MPKEELGSKAGECVRVSTATPAGLTATNVNDGFLTAEEAAWLVDAICPPDLEAAA